MENKKVLTQECKFLIGIGILMSMFYLPIGLILFFIAYSTYKKDNLTEEQKQERLNKYKQQAERTSEKQRQRQEKQKQRQERQRQRQEERQRLYELEQQRIYEFEQKHELELDLLRMKYSDFYSRVKRTKLPSVHFTYSCPFNIVPYVVHEWNRNSEIIQQAYSRCRDKASSNINVINRALNTKNYSDSNIQMALNLINETEELISQMENEHRKYMLEIDIMKKSESIIAYKIK